MASFTTFKLTTAPLVKMDGRHFVFLHNGREIWDCDPLGADDAELLMDEILSEKRWFTDSHREQFAKLVTDHFGSGGTDGQED